MTTAAELLGEGLAGEDPKAGEQAAGEDPKVVKQADGEDPKAGEQPGAEDPKAGEQAAGEDPKAGEAEPKDVEPKISDRERELLQETMSRKEKIRNLEKELERFQGIDPKEVRVILKERKDAERQKLEDQGAFEEVKRQMKEEHDADMKALMAKIDERESTIKSLTGEVEELTVGQAFAQSTFVKDKLTLPLSKARVLYGAHFEREDGKVVGYTKPKGESGRAPFVDGDGNPLPFDNALEKLVMQDPDKDALVKSSIRQGAGSGTSGDPATPKEPEAAPGRSRIHGAITAGALGKPDKGFDL